MGASTDDLRELEPATIELWLKTISEPSETIAPRKVTFLQLHGESVEKRCLSQMEEYFGANGKNKRSRKDWYEIANILKFTSRADRDANDDFFDGLRWLHTYDEQFDNYSENAKYGKAFDQQLMCSLTGGHSSDLPMPSLTTRLAQFHLQEKVMAKRQFEIIKEAATYSRDWTNTALQYAWADMYQDIPVEMEELLKKSPMTEESFLQEVKEGRIPSASDRVRDSAYSREIALGKIDMEEDINPEKIGQLAKAWLEYALEAIAKTTVIFTTCDGADAHLAQTGFRPDIVYVDKAEKVTMAQFSTFATNFFDWKACHVVGTERSSIKPNPSITRDEWLFTSSRSLMEDFRDAGYQFKPVSELGAEDEN